MTLMSHMFDGRQQRASHGRVSELCHFVFSTKPQCEPMLTHCQLHIRYKLLYNSKQNIRSICQEHVFGIIAENMSAIWCQHNDLLIQFAILRCIKGEWAFRLHGNLLYGFHRQRGLDLIFDQPVYWTYVFSLVKLWSIYYMESIISFASVTNWLNKI